MAPTPDESSADDSSLTDPLISPSIVDIYDHPVDEPPPSEPPPPRRRRLSSVKKTLGNLIVSIVGSGVLGLPFAFKQSGWLYALLCLACMALVSFYGMLLLVLARRHAEEEAEKAATSEPLAPSEAPSSDGASSSEAPPLPVGATPSGPAKAPPPAARIESYGDLGFAALGAGGRLLIDACIVLSQGGFCVAYLIFIGQNVSSIVRGDTGLQAAVIAALAPFQMLLAWMKSLTRLASFSIVADVANLAAFAVVIFHGVLSSRGVARLSAFTGLRNAPIAFGVAAYAFEGVAMTLPLESTMRQRHRFPAVLSLGLSLIASVYASVGMAGYAGFGEATREIITLNLPPNWVTAAVKLAISFALCFTFPVMMLPVHEVNERRLSALPAVQQWVLPRRLVRRYFFRGVRSLAVLLVAAVAACVPRFTVFISLVGSSVCSLLAFTIPGLIHLRLGAAAAGVWWVASDVLLVGFGVLVGCWGTYDSICRFLES